MRRWWSPALGCPGVSLGMELSIKQSETLSHCSLVGRTGVCLHGGSGCRGDNEPNVYFTNQAQQFPLKLRRTPLVIKLQVKNTTCTRMFQFWRRNNEVLACQNNPPQQHLIYLAGFLWLHLAGDVNERCLFPAHPFFADGGEIRVIPPRLLFGGKTPWKAAPWSSVGLKAGILARFSTSPRFPRLWEAGSKRGKETTCAVLCPPSLPRPYTRRSTGSYL